MNLGEMGLEGVDWIHVAKNTDQWRTLVDSETNFRVP
jgi:hypothetical protein